MVEITSSSFPNTIILPSMIWKIIEYGFAFECFLFGLQTFYLLFVILPRFLFICHVLALLYLVLQINCKFCFLYSTDDLTPIFQLKNKVHECKICFQKKANLLQFKCCPYAITCHDCIHKITKCIICRRKLKNI